MFKVQKRSKDIIKIVHLFNLEMAAETDMEDNKLLNKVSIFERLMSHGLFYRCH